MIKKTLNKYEAWDEVKKYSEGYANKYTLEGFDALFEHMENYSNEIEVDLEFDFIAWCCDYTEYKTAWEAMQEYQPEDMPTVEISDDENPDLVEISEKSEALALDWLEERTDVIKFDGGIIIRNF